MKIGKNTVVALVYELVVDGQVADKCTQERPLDYIHGTGTLLKKFEENLEGLEPGCGFKFTLTPAEGYGEVDPERVIELPKEAFVVKGEFRDDLIVVGNRIPLVNSSSGVVPGIIKAVNENSVTIDLNSEMAGKTLNFSGKILTVREATEKELAEGLHGENLRCNCGGGCGNCNGNCSDSGCGSGECGNGNCSGSGCNDGKCNGN